MVESFKIIAFAIFTIASPLISGADLTSDQSRIDSFLAARKFDQAEFLCREQLSDANLETAQRAGYTVELLRVLTRQAEEVAVDERRQLFQTAEREAQTYLAGDRDSHRRLLVRFQAALLPRIQAVLRQYDRPRNPSEGADPAVLKDFRGSTRQLRLLSTDVAETLRNNRNRDPRDKGRLSRKELNNLQARIVLELGRTHRLQAEAYPPGSDDRVLAAAESVRYLQRLAPASLSQQCGRRAVWSCWPGHE